ncbi:MAG: IS66 family insertion sequence element accessory protein TnpA [Chloroflexota bacterium]
MRKIMRRGRRGAEAWRELVSQQAESGLSVAAFCRREEIVTCSFYARRSRVRRGGRAE